MTHDEMVTAVLEELGEPPLAPVHWTRSEVAEYIREWVILYAWMTFCYQKTVTVTISAGTHVHLRTLVPDFVRVLAMRHSGSGQRIRPVSLQQIAAYDETWPSATGGVAGYRAAGDLVTLFAPMGATVVLRYVAEPPTSAGDQIPMERGELEKLKRICRWRARWKHGAQEMAKWSGDVRPFFAMVRERARIVREEAISASYDVAPAEDRWFERSIARIIPRVEKVVKSASGS